MGETQAVQNQPNAIMITGRMARAINEFATEMEEEPTVVVPEGFVGGSFQRGFPEDSVFAMIHHHPSTDGQGKPTVQYTMRSVSALNTTIASRTCDPGQYRGPVGQLFGDNFQSGCGFVGHLDGDLRHETARVITAALFGEDELKSSSPVPTPLGGYQSVVISSGLWGEERQKVNALRVRMGLEPLAAPKPEVESESRGGCS